MESRFENTYIMCLHPVRPHLDVRVVHDNNILAKNIPQVPCDYQRNFTVYLVWSVSVGCSHACDGYRYGSVALPLYANGQ